ncbi:isochorismatase family protein [Kitasatospora kifunensis]|uniref:Nicotinamidase-related amidase n=2 Tax=Kitasatospora kifunensis TaxID=58351 RepID=A0A7W7R6N8_KITKI|nr:isochorismatase family protein [Kitasatospora kifunensis]MBB4926417.1 nicotinamidase-related amidase [Kitasatospora kifunensis]
MATTPASTTLASTTLANTAATRSALIVIDVQESFRRRPNWAAVSDPQIVEQVNRLVAVARAKGDLVVWVLHVEPGTGNVFDPALGHVRLMEGLAPLDGEPVITKTAHNAFTTTNLQQLLVQHGVGELVISGLRTEQCCETTTRVGFDLGYQVVFVTDATATHPIEHRDAPAGRSLAEILADPSTLGTEEIIARTEYALAGRFARIATVAELERG